MGGGLFYALGLLVMALLTHRAELLVRWQGTASHFE
jgi:hypothetical protein